MMLLRAKAPTVYRDNSMVTINQVIKAVQGFDPAEVLGLGMAKVTTLDTTDSRRDASE